MIHWEFTLNTGENENKDERAWCVQVGRQAGFKQ